MKKIACVVVTYNRKILLKRCLEAIDSQSYKPSTVFIVDNASTDDTIGSVKEWGYFDCARNGIQYKYVLNEKNEGGAGGFHLGMLTAMNDPEKFDGLWVMDDDGVPEKDCLNQLMSHFDSFHFLSPMVVDVENRQMTSFYGCTVEEFSRKGKNGLVLGEANPFNGILFSRKLVEDVGLPKKEMFIWGDEINYMQRALKAGYESCTVLGALHGHPMDRQEFKTSCFGRIIKYTDVKWKLYCHIRNTVYNVKIWKKGLGCLVSSLASFTKYAYYYVFIEKKWSYFPLIFKATVCGYFEIWGGHFKYMHR